MKWWREGGPEARRALAAGMFGWMLDAFDVMLFALVLPCGHAPIFGLTKAQAGFLGSVMLVAAAAGGVGFGWFADRFGRTRALMLSVLLYSVFTFACGFATTSAQFVVFRIFLGLGMGGEWTSGAALVSETWPAQHRGKALGFMQSGWAIGYAAAVLVSGFVQPRYGWRAVFFVGILPALFTLWVRRNVKEPAIWTASSRSGEAVPGLLSIFQERHRAASRSSLTLMNTCTLFAWWGFNLWLPSYLKSSPDQGGAGLSGAATTGYLFIMQAGMWFGYVTFGFVSDRFGRKRTYVELPAHRGGAARRLRVGAEPVDAARARTVRRVCRDRLLQRLRRGHGRDLSDLGPRHRAGLHLQHRPSGQRRRAVPRSARSPTRTASAPRCSSARPRSSRPRSCGSGFRKREGGRSPDVGLGDVRDDAEDVVQLDVVAGLDRPGHGLLADAGPAGLALHVVRIEEVDVERHLAVDTHRLDLRNHRLLRALQHPNSIGFPALP